MTKRSWLLVAVVLTLAGAGVAYAQFPIMEKVADKVIAKYQGSTCEQLWQNRGKKSPEEARVVNFLKTDPQMREAFLNKIGGPVLNKMFECGMIP